MRKQSDKFRLQDIQQDNWSGFFESVNVYERLKKSKETFLG